jgi:hypothetical protein
MNRKQKRARKRERSERLQQIASATAPTLRQQHWHGNGPCGPTGQCLALHPKHLAVLLEDGYRNTWERRVVMVAEPITERKRAPVPDQNWEASAQAKRYASRLNP